MTESEEGSLKVLLEEMNDKFSLVLEGHDAIRHEFKEQIVEIKEEQQLFKSLLKGSHDELKSEIQGVRTELKEEMSAGFKELGTKVEGHEDRIRFLERKTA
ncbi:MAG: hypothetical protein ACE5DY_08145 [Mariprofundaceae bacterium]